MAPNLSCLIPLYRCLSPMYLPKLPQRTVFWKSNHGNWNLQNDKSRVYWMLPPVKPLLPSQWWSSMENQNQIKSYGIKTGLPKEQFITYDVPTNASAALTFNTISKSSSIADSEKVHWLQIGTVAPIILRGVLPVLICSRQWKWQPNVFRELLGSGVVVWYVNEGNILWKAL